MANFKAHSIIIEITNNKTQTGVGTTCVRDALLPRRDSADAPIPDPGNGHAHGDGRGHRHNYHMSHVSTYYCIGDSCMVYYYYYC